MKNELITVFGRIVLDSDPMVYTHRHVMDSLPPKCKELGYPSIRKVMNSLHTDVADWEAGQFAPLDTNRYIPILPAIPADIMNRKPLNTELSFGGENSLAVWNIDFDAEWLWREMDGEEEKYLHFWAETVTAILGAKVVYSINDKTYYKSYAKGDENKEAIKRYIDLYTKWESLYDGNNEETPNYRWSEFVCKELR